MKLTMNKIVAAAFMLFLGFGLITSCNKDVEGPTPIAAPQPVSSRSLLDTINNDANLTILKAAIARASTNNTFGNSLTTLLSDKSASFTFFAPTDAAFQMAFQLLGIPPAAGVNAFRPGQLDTILRYHFAGGRITGDTIARRLPNLQVPSQFVLQQPSATLPPGLRQSIFPGRNVNTYFVNNVPVTQAEIPVANGLVYKIGAVLLPPSQFLWNRIDTDPNLTYLKAAVQRADSGVAAAATLTAALQNPAANLTVFAPTNAAFQALLAAQIEQALVAQGVPQPVAQAQAQALSSTPAVFTNPALSSVLTPTNVRGLVAYHVLGNRRFSVNIPTTATSIPTLAHSQVPTLPLLSIRATFGATGVTAATVKGGANATESNIQINPLPAPAGTSDQNYINGVLHIIDQVLRPM